MNNTKVCKKCGEEKPVNEFYPQSKRRADGGLIYQASCKKCTNKKNYERLVESGKHKDKNKWVTETGYTAKRWRKNHPLLTLTCPICDATFTQADGKQKYCSKRCSTRFAQRAKHERDTGKKYGERSSPTEKTCNRCGQTKPLSEFSKRHGRVCNDCLPVYYAEMHRKHKAYYRRKTRERELKLAGVEGDHTQQEWEEVKAKQDYTCLCCKKREPEITLTKDHIVPIVRGGTDYITNIQGLCVVCNASKSTKTIDYR